MQSHILTLLLTTATLLCGLAFAQSSSPLGPKQVFEFGSTGEIAVSPLGTRVYVSYSEKGAGSFAGFFLLKANESHWEQLSPMNREGLELWPVQWGTHENEEVLIVPQWRDRAIVFQEDVALVAPIPTSPLTREIPKADKSAYLPRWKAPEAAQDIIGELLGRISESLAPDARTLIATALREAKATDILEISSDERTVLIDYAGGSRYKGTVVGINLETGDFVEFAIGNNRNSSVEGAHTCFSPDGQYVLIRFRYTPEHVSAPVPGYLQLFTADGHFVEELTAYDADGFWNLGDFTWLYNNWIVYTTPNKLVFQKVIP